MIKNYTYINAVFLLLIFVSCTKTKVDKTYFGGQIINPKTDHVILFEKETPIDTFYLAENNRFLAEIENIKEGLYYFRHADEFQYIYLEPKDSLLIRLNTLNFDESLVFSGKGAERNNFLLDCFMDAETENKRFYEYYMLNPTDFSKVVDSLETVMLKKYDEFYSRNREETKEFLTFLKTALTYPLYSKIENYPLNHARILKKKNFPTTDENFYKHRDAIILDNESLVYYSVYSNFLTNYLYNKTYASGFTPKTKDYSARFTKKLLEITNENIKVESTKNILLKQQIKYHFFRNSQSTINQGVFNTYFSLNTNLEFGNQIKSLVGDLDKVKENQEIINFSLFDFNDTQFYIKEIIKGKNTVLYFWNPKYISENFLSSRINYLITNNINVQFIGIKIDGNNERHIEKLDIKNQYYIDESSIANTYLTSKYPRVILLDKNGIVKNSYASISSKKIYTQVRTLNKTN